MSESDKTPEDLALEYISESRYHRRFVFPSTAQKRELSVTYADIGLDPKTSHNSHVPTVLFMPGMFASRYLGVMMHAIASKIGVRVLLVDRPGMGGSTNVPIEMRVPVWLELVPRLLAHLSIDHVALVSHSSGTIYLLNTLFYCRHVLHPQQPYISFLAPWVNPSKSRVTAMQMAQHLPSKAFNIWNQIPRFFLLKASPVVGSSGAAMGRIHGAFHGDVRNTAAYSKTERDRLKIQKEYRIPKEVQAEVDKHVWEFVFEEDTVGANAEAMQCLRKGPKGSWGKCDDYEVFVQELVQEMRGSAGSESVQGQDAADRKENMLTVQAYFAESDSMISLRGQAYFEGCWTDEKFQDVLHFETMIIGDEDHDSLGLAPSVLAKVFHETKHRCK